MSVDLLCISLTARLSLSIFSLDYRPFVFHFELCLHPFPLGLLVFNYLNQFWGAFHALM